MFMHPRSANWEVPVEACSALSGEQTTHIWETMKRFRATRNAAGLLTSARAEQARNWMWNEIRNGLVERLKASPDIAKRALELEQAVKENRMSPTSAADELMDIFIGRKKQ